MNYSNFWFDFFSNALATILGVVIGIPIALWFDRRRENKQKSDTDKIKAIRVENILERLFVQVINIGLEIDRFFDSDNQELLLLAYFPEVEVMKSLHAELTELDANWDVLHSLEITYSQIQAINNLLNVYRDFFGLKMHGKLSSVSKYNQEMKEEMSLVSTSAIDSIEYFKSTVIMKYPNFDKHLRTVT